MGQYLASQIILGRMTYAQVMATKWGKKFKDVIDKTLDERGYRIDADGNCVKKPAEDSGADESSGTTEPDGTTSASSGTDTSARTDA